MGSLGQTSLSPPSHLCSPSSSPGAMPCFQRCCCCVNLRTGGLMMGFMTLVMSVFSIIPMAISLSSRLYLSRVVVYMLRRYGTNTEDEDYDDSDSEPFEPMEFWGTVNEVLTGAEDNLPEEDNTRVTRLATASLIFFIVCIILLAYIAGMILSAILFGVTLLSIAFLAIAIIESCIALYLWACVISLFQLLADRQASSQAWELKPRLNTSYNQSYKGIPTEDR